MKVYISGGSGFVGQNLLKYFLNFNIGTNILSRERLTSQDIFSENEVSAFVHLAGLAHDKSDSYTEYDYYSVNFDLSRKIFDKFLASSSSCFIYISSVKAVADEVEGELSEEINPNPITHYGKSKLLAEQYILSQSIPEDKRVYILRPCMIHGPGNKGNLNLLYNLVSKGLPWPLGLFENSRSYLSIDNLCFIIRELIERDDISSGVYNVADDVPLSTNDLIKMIAESKGRKAKILYLSKNFIKGLALLGDFLKLPLNSERLKKLTESYIVSNNKINEALGKRLPVSSNVGLVKTFQSFSQNV